MNKQRPAPMMTGTTSRLSAGWRVLRRHLRYARGDPRKILWIVQRTWNIVRRGELKGVLQRHRVVENFYAGYPDWLRARRDRLRVRAPALLEELDALSDPTSFAILLPVYNPPVDLLEEALDSVLSQSYQHWRLCIVDDGSSHRGHIARLQAYARRDPRITVVLHDANGGIAHATNAALDMAGGDFCVFLDQDDALEPHALLLLAAYLREHGDMVVVYGDEDHVNADGTVPRPAFKPDFDPEWLRTTNYILHPTVIRTDVVRQVAGLRPDMDGVQDWDLLLRVSERVGGDRIGHIPEVLYHWRVHAGSTAAGVHEKSGIVAAQRRVIADTIARRGESADIESTAGGWRIRFHLPSPRPRVSLVIPTRDRPDLLRMCVHGLRHGTRYGNWEAVIIDNGTVDSDALALLAALELESGFKVLRDAGDFNYSRLCNAGVRASSGSVLVLLNNDVEPINDDWLDELVAQATRPEIGLVGAALYYPDNTIQHMGVVLGLNGVADRPYVGYPRGFRGVDSRLGYVHQVSAMITACAAIRREIYDMVGGMDETLPISCNDLDLCLRVGERGFRNIVTPFAELHHHESATRGYRYRSARNAQEAIDEARFATKWGERLEHDPAYNPNLTRKGLAFSLGAA